MGAIPLQDQPSRDAVRAERDVRVAGEEHGLGDDRIVADWAGDRGVGSVGVVVEG